MDPTPPRCLPERSPVKVLVADNLAEAGVTSLGRHHDVDVKTGLSKAELLEVIAAYHAIVVRSSTTVDTDVIAAGTSLKVIARAGIGLDNVDVDAATRAGIIVCNAPQSNIVSAAEHTVAMILALSRNIPQANAALKAGRWERSQWKGTELQGKVLGVVGLGRIGVLVAQRASAFGMRLTAFDPYVAQDRAARMGVELVDDLDDLLAGSDYVTVHLPRNPETVGLIGARELDLMKPSARLVNVARGGIVDEAALADALRDGTIAGAALDVFDSEPATESPLFELDNVVVTPHLGASTQEAQDKAGLQVAEAVELALAGEFVPSAVNVQGGTIDDRVRPFLPLGEKLGRLYTALAEGGFDGEITVEYVGELAAADDRVLGLSVLKGLLAGVVHEPVTFVNAPLLAEDRGVHLREVSETHSEDYVSLLRVEGTSRDGRRLRVAGTILQPTGSERLVEVWNLPVDLEPTRHMAFFRYEDRPGIIGAVGTILGEAEVNIASAQVGRHQAGGEAIMALALDDPPTAEVVQAITEEIGAHEGRAITLE
ncbi:MAG: phosphoglycerate dehydrogenase [Actinobacteria bacterium]|nr:phosphoglycerate dehydrogenase [Actinomycetota bacterium]